MNTPTPSLETPRLLLYPLKIADATQVQRLFPKWEVVRYLNKSIPWPYPSDGAYAFYRDVALPAVANGTAWDWTIRTKQTPDQIIGGITLRISEDENRGFWLGLPWHRQGFMTEACECVTDFWFDTLGFDVLRVTKAAANTASRRISENQGMKLVSVEERDYVSGRLQAEVWVITKDQWRSRR